MHDDDLKAGTLGLGQKDSKLDGEVKTRQAAKEIVSNTEHI